MIRVLGLEQSTDWDNIVKTFNNYDVYYLSGYVKAFQIHGDGQPLLFYYEDDFVRGINVVMKRDVADDILFSNKIEKDTYFDFITPYGYGGWIIEGEATQNLFLSYEKWCLEHNIVSEFVRYHPVIENHISTHDCYEVIPLGGTICMDISSSQVIWENITSKNRNMIRKAQKSGLKIHSGNSPELYEEFRSIYNATMDKDNADGYYYFGEEFYNSILNDLKDESQIFYAELEGKIIAASIILATNGRLNYHLSGSLREFQNLAPTNLLLYETAVWGSENGYKTLHLGGGVGSREDSLFKFKKAFNRQEPHRFNIGKKIFNQVKYDELLNLRDNLPESSFFPKYRAL